MTNPQTITEHIFENQAELYTTLSTYCARQLDEALDTSGQASILVPGGATPKQLFRQLCQSELDWSRVFVALVDERWVDEGHPASNADLVKSLLLQQRAAKATFIEMKNSSSSAEQACEQVNELYREIPAPFDLLILGMGADGHIASLFPHAPGLGAALDLANESLCCAIKLEVDEIGNGHKERMSLTLNGILRARRIVLLITGEEKLGIYQEALKNPCFEQLPVSALLQQQQRPIDVYWAP